MNKIKFCISTYWRKLDSKGNEIGGINESVYWYDTVDAAIADKPKYYEQMKSELASHLPCARKREKGNICITPWFVNDDGDALDDAWGQLSDDEKIKLNLANEITDIWGRDL